MSSPLPSEALTCNLCSGPLEIGQLYGEGRGQVGTIVFVPQGPAGDSPPIVSLWWLGAPKGHEPLAKSRPPIAGDPVTFRAARCVKCRRVEFRY